MATEKLEDMLTSEMGLQTVTRKSHGRRSRSRDQQVLSHDREWPVPSLRKSHVGTNIRTSHGNQERAGSSRSERKKWNQNGPDYQNENQEYGTAISEEESRKQFYPPGGGRPNPGPPQGVTASGPRMGPGHGPEFGSGHGSMNRFTDYYPPDIGMGRDAAFRPFGPGMPRGYDFYSGTRMGNEMYHQRPGYYYDNQYQSHMMEMMGGPSGPHPRMQGGGAPYPMMMMPPQYPRQPPSAVATSQQTAMMSHRGEVEHRERWTGSSGRGYVGGPHPSLQKRSESPYSDFQTVSRDRRHKWGDDKRVEEYTSERQREQCGLVPKYPPASRSHSAGDAGGSGQKGKKKMILLRGLPGSGKTTLAR